MGLQCPDCKQPLQTTFYEGVKVNFCLHCKGFFLGKDNLQQIVRIRDAVIPRDSRPRFRRTTEITRQCPQCQIPMKKGTYGKLRTTTFDLCEKCANLWLDQGEIDDIQLDYEMVSDNKARSQKQSAAAPAQNAAAPVPVADRPVQSAPARFQCPKCGHAQEKGIECAKCGIIFAKYEALQQERATHEAHATTQTAQVDEILTKLNGFEVQQQHHLTEALVGFERANRYTVQPVPASATQGNWQIEETNRSGLSILGRNLLGSLYTFTMTVYDESRNRVLMLERRARFYFFHLDIFDENGRLIGAARRRFSWFHRVVTVQDDRGAELMQIVGPLHRPWTFLLRRSGADAGSIVKKWSGALKEVYTDADKFSMRFTCDLDTKCRRLALGAMMLIDSLYFEGRRPFIGHFLGAPGIQILLIVVLTGAILFPAELNFLPRFDSPPPAVARTGVAIKQNEFQSLLDRDKSLASLAVPRQYTVVEVYLDTCAICRKLETGFPGLTAERTDVTIQRVHFPEDGISFASTGSSQQEVEQKVRAFQNRMEAFQICGTPHVEIYGPRQQAIARDVCGDKSGTKYLRQWIAAETGAPISTLQTGAGAQASTPLPDPN